MTRDQACPARHACPGARTDLRPVIGASGPAPSGRTLPPARLPVPHHSPSLLPHPLHWRYCL